MGPTRAATGSPKHIFVTGGVASSLGKGLTASSLGNLLTARGLRVVMQKLDPYLNVDPGTMNPFQHGEVFVTEDGAETDLDVGHYERFLDRNLSAKADGAKQSVKNVALYAVLGLIGAVVGMAVLVTAAVLLVMGLGHSLGVLFGYRMWLGELVAGALVLGGVGVGAWLMVKKLTNNWKSALVKKYEARKAEQRAKFGQTVEDRANERRSPQSQDAS